MAKRLHLFFQRRGVGIFLLFVVALCMRLVYLGRAELWQDEMLLMQTANPTATPLQIWQSYWQIAVSMAWLPLPAVLENIYLRALQPVDAGFILNPFYIRLPGALAGALAVPCIAGLGLFIGGRRLGWVSGLWAALTFFFIFYSREVHAYPLLLLLSASNWLFLARFWNSKTHHPVGYWVFGGVQIAMALTHLTAAFMICCTGAVTLGLVIIAWHRREREQSLHFLYVGLGQGAGLLAVAPYYFLILTQKNPHLAMHRQTPFCLMLNDFVSRVMFGEHLWAAVAGWGVLVIGIWAVWQCRHSAQSAKPLLIAAGLSFVLIALAAKRTQYVSARYFIVIAPLAAIFASAGLLRLGEGIARIFKRTRDEYFISVAVALALIPHLFIFLPPYYQLPTKSVDFGAIARWINNNLSPKQPYLMESAHELRFVGGYFPTPGKTGAAPYFISDGSESLRQSYKCHQEFIQRFPEAPFIESAHHNWDKSGGVWEWPHQFYARHIQLRNEPLRSLIRLGIYPGTPKEKINDYAYVTDIYYNLPEDIALKEKESGEAAIFRWTDWNCVPYAQDSQTRVVEYGRMAPGASANVTIENLAGDSLKGVLRLDLAVIAPSGKIDVILLSSQKESPQVFHCLGGQFQTLEKQDFVLPAAGATFEIKAVGVQATNIKGILVRSAQFMQSEDCP